MNTLPRLLCLAALLLTTATAHAYDASEAFPGTTRVQDPLERAAELRKGGWSAADEAPHVTERVQGSQRVQAGQAQADSLFLRGESNPPAARGRNVNLRKQIGVAAFHIQNPSHASDLANAGAALGRELFRQLERSGQFRMRDYTGVRFDLYGAPELLRVLWPRDGTQFLVQVSIEDMERHSPFPSLLRNVEAFRYLPAERRLRLTLRVIDTLAGQPVAVHQYEDVSITGLLHEPPRTPEGGDFGGSMDGTTLERIIAVQVADVLRDLSALPWMAKVVETDGPLVYLNAGTQAGLRPGDRIVGYSLGREVGQYGYLQDLGRREEVASTLVIEKVQPLFAVARRENNARMKVGDLVREW